MKYQDRVDMMKALDPAQLCGGKTPADKAEAYYRWHVLELLADLAENFSSFAYSQSQLLKVHQAKAGKVMSDRADAARAARNPGDGQ